MYTKIRIILLSWIFVMRIWNANTLNGNPAFVWLYNSVYCALSSASNAGLSVRHADGWSALSLHVLGHTQWCMLSEWVRSGVNVTHLLCRRVPVCMAPLRSSQSPHSYQTPAGVSDRGQRSKVTSSSNSKAFSQCREGLLNRTLPWESIVTVERLRNFLAVKINVFCCWCSKDPLSLVKHPSLILRNIQTQSRTVPGGVTVGQEWPNTKLRIHPFKPVSNGRATAGRLMPLCLIILLTKMSHLLWNYYVRWIYNRWM